ncbi:hypothetical protein MPSEU_000508900 [Mayamaea pseudoterrestris]|nr:hypothetical protein MPSEU_000508900 [Mayamaea pseudoterrestris]
MQLCHAYLTLVVLLVSLQIPDAAAWTFHNRDVSVSRQSRLQSKSRHCEQNVCLHMNSKNSYTDSGYAKNSPAPKKSLFAQPAYTQQSSGRAQSTETASALSPRIYKPKKPFQSDSTMMSLHQERLQSAGRIGTKRFVNPCKLFIGNLAYETTETDLQDLLQQSLGAHLPDYLWLHRLHIVRDWKTSKSKGYAFCDFTEPHFATVCILKCHNMELHGRQLVVKQGVKQLKPNEVYVSKTKREPLTDEEVAIQAGLAQAEEEELMVLDPDQVSMLRRLDPDLLPDYLQIDSLSSTSRGVKLKQLQKEQRKEQQRVQTNMLSVPATAVRDQDFRDDLDIEYDGNNEDLYELDIDDDDDDDDFEFDGDYDDEEEGEFDDDGAPKLVGEHDDQPMNREQRRQAAKAVKRRKKPAKGFGK